MCPPRRPGQRRWRGRAQARARRRPLPRSAAEHRCRPSGGGGPSWAVVSGGTQVSGSGWEWRVEGGRGVVGAAATAVCASHAPTTPPVVLQPCPPRWGRPGARVARAQVAPRARRGAARRPAHRTRRRDIGGARAGNTPRRGHRVRPAGRRPPRAPRVCRRKAEDITGRRAALSPSTGPSRPRASPVEQNPASCADTARPISTTRSPHRRNARRAARARGGSKNNSTPR